MYESVLCPGFIAVFHFAVKSLLPNQVRISQLIGCYKGNSF